MKFEESALFVVCQTLTLTTWVMAWCYHQNHITTIWQQQQVIKFKFDAHGAVIKKGDGTVLETKVPRVAVQIFCFFLGKVSS